MYMLEYVEQKQQRRRRRRQQQQQPQPGSFKLPVFSVQLRDQILVMIEIYKVSS